MKKLQLVLIVSLSVFIFSCNKKDVAPQQQNESKVPHFDETNSSKVSWDQLPSELKNAMEIKPETNKPQSSGIMSSAFSYYSHMVGPWGGSGGYPFSIYPPDGSRIYAIAISSGGLIDRIVIWYQTANGTIYVGGDRGGSGGIYHVQYFSSDEYIVSVSGRSGGLLDRLTIHTNRKSFSYGGNGGTPFYVSVPYGYQVLGFWGRSGGVIDQIGFYVYTR